MNWWWRTASLGEFGNVKLELSAFECAGMNAALCLLFAGPVQNELLVLLQLSEHTPAALSKIAAGTGWRFSQ